MLAVDERFLLGLGLCLLNCLLSSVGFTLQRKAQLLSEEAGASSSRWLCRALRAIGVVLYISAAAPDVLAYTLVPQVVCTTVACFRLVVVAVLAHSFLQERVRWREGIGMAICSVGTSICLACGPVSQRRVLAPSDGLYHPRVWTYLSACCGLLVALLALEHAGGAKDREGLARPLVLPTAAGLAFALGKLFNTELGFVAAPQTPQGALEAPVWAGMTLVMGLLGLIDFYLNVRAAARMPVQIFLPISFTVATMLQLYQSMAIFGEFQGMLPMHSALSVGGAAVALCGALLIQPPGCVGAQGDVAKDLESNLLKGMGRRRSMEVERKSDEE